MAIIKKESYRCDRCDLELAGDYESMRKAHGRMLISLPNKDLVADPSEGRLLRKAEFTAVHLMSNVGFSNFMLCLPCARSLVKWLLPPGEAQP